MKNTTLGIHIEGPGISPDKIALRDLIAVLDDLDQLINRATQHVSGDRYPGSISLTSISSGSLNLAFDAYPEHAQGARFVVGQIKGNSRDALPWLRKHSRSLWRFSQDYDCQISLDVPGTFDAPVVFIDPQTEPFEPPIADGGTSVIGTVMRVGGRKPRATAQLLLAGGERITAYLENEAMAKVLGERLYQTVALEGQATWDTRDWTIDSFKATAICSYNETSLASTFAALAELSGDRWDNIDPSNFVRSLRDD